MPRDDFNQAGAPDMTAEQAIAHHAVEERAMFYEGMHESCARLEARRGQLVAAVDAINEQLVGISAAMAQEPGPAVPSSTMPTVAGHR